MEQEEKSLLTMVYKKLSVRQNHKVIDPLFQIKCSNAVIMLDLFHDF